MVYIDTQKADSSLTPSTEAWEVLDCNERFSQGGDQMLSLKFCKLSDPREHLFDMIMLEGRGWGIGKQKLVALLGEGFQGELSSTDLIHTRLWIATKVEEFNGKSSLKPDIKRLKNAGYQAIEDVPPGCVAPEPPAPDPF